MSDILYDKVYEYKLLETDTDVKNMFAEQKFEEGLFFLCYICLNGLCSNLTVRLFKFVYLI